MPLSEWPQNHQCRQNCPHCPDQIAIAPEADRHALICPNVTVACLYASMGCEERPKRKDMTAHLESRIPHHLQLLGEKMSKLQQTQNLPPLCQADATIKDLFERVITLEQGFRHLTLSSAASRSTPPLNQLGHNGVHVWRIRPFGSRLETMRQAGGPLYSEDFFTAPQLGYRACVRCSMTKGPSGGDHLGFFVHLMAGPDDDILDWPFRGDIELTLKCRGLGPDVTEKLSSSPGLSAFDRPPSGTRRNPIGFGLPQFIALERVLDRQSGFWGPHKDDLVLLVRLKVTPWVS